MLKYTINETTVDIEAVLANTPHSSSTVNAVVDWFGPIDMALMDIAKAPRRRLTGSTYRGNL